jgi:hypothetical protein
VLREVQLALLRVVLLAVLLVQLALPQAPAAVALLGKEEPRLVWHLGREQMPVFRR